MCVVCVLWLRALLRQYHWFYRSVPIFSLQFEATLAPSLSREFVWPTTQDVLSTQEKHRDTDNSDKLQTVSHGLLANNDGAICIPSADSPLQLRICIIAHCGPAGHRHIAATYSAIKKRFFWKCMRSDVSVFCNTCLQCKLAVNGQSIPRPMGHACRVLLFEFRLQMKKWPSVMHIVQTILNHSTRPSLGNVAPMTAFLGLPVDHPLDTILAPPHAEVRSMGFVITERLLSIKSLLTFVDFLHKQVSATRSRTCKKSIDTHNQRTNGHPDTF